MDKAYKLKRFDGIIPAKEEYIEQLEKIKRISEDYENDIIRIDWADDGA